MSESRVLGEVSQHTRMSMSLVVGLSMPSSSSKQASLTTSSYIKASSCKTRRALQRSDGLSSVTNVINQLFGDFLNTKLPFCSFVCRLILRYALNQHKRIENGLTTVPSFSLRRLTAANPAFCRARNSISTTNGYAVIFIRMPH